MSGSTVKNCYALGTSKFAPEDAIVFTGWNDGTVSGCIDLARASQTERSRFYQSCGWDFSKIWDKSQTYPVLRGCDQAAQLAARR